MNCVCRTIAAFLILLGPSLQTASAQDNAQDRPPIDESHYQLPGATTTLPDWVGKRPGEPFNVKEFLENRVPPEQNAAPLYIYAMSQFSPLFLYLYPESEQEAVRLRTTEFTKRIASIIQSENFEELAVSEEGEAILKDAQPYSALIDEAQKRKNCLFVHPKELNSQIPHAQVARDVARLTQIAVVNACNTADFTRAEHAFQRLLRLSRDLRPQGALIANLVSVALDAIVVDLLQNSYLGHPELTVADCDRMVAVLTEHQRAAADILNEGIKYEYVLLVNVIEGLRSGRLTPASLSFLDIDAGLFKIINFDAERDAAAEVYAMALSAREYTHYMKDATKDLNGTIDRMRSAFDTEAKSLGSALTLALGSKLRNPIICILMFPAIDQFFEASRRAKAKINGAILLTAVRRYQLKHGKLPELLQMAAKEVGIEAVPMDPYDPYERPMRYSVVYGKPVVYSIGSDGKDDRGLVDWNFGRQPGDILFTIP